MKILIDIADIDKELLDKDLCGDERIKAILFAVKNGIPISEKENEIDNGLIDYLCEQIKLFKKYDSIAISLTGKEMFHILQNLIAERLANYSSNLKKKKEIDP